MSQLQLPHIPRPRARQMLFSIVRRLTEYRWLEIETFVRASREGMTAAWERFKKDFDETTAGWSQEKKDRQVEWMLDDISNLRDASPQLMRYSHCLIVFGTFEHAIADICWSIHRDGKIAQAPPPRLYTHKARKYLAPHIGARPAPFATDWDWLDEFRVLRNWIAHNAGTGQKDLNPGSDWMRAQSFVNRNRGMLKFNHHQEIEIEDELIDRAIRYAQDSIIRIEKATDKLYR